MDEILNLIGTETNTRLDNILNQLIRIDNALKDMCEKLGEEELPEKYIEPIEGQEVDVVKKLDVKHED